MPINLETMVAPFAPLHEIQCSELSNADLQDYKSATPNSEEVLETFEEAWKSFLEEKKVDLLGKTGQQIEAFQQTAQAALEEKEKLEQELKSETAYYRKSLDDLEKEYKTKRNEIRKHRDAVELESPLRKIERSFTEEKVTQPWFHFIEQLDKMSKLTPPPHQASSSFELSKPSQPSQRSMALLQSNDLFLAHRIDHELARFHLQMLATEIEIYQAQNPYYEFMSKILSEHNVWEILKEKTSKLEP